MWELWKKSFPFQNTKETKEIKVSTTDSESDYYVKDEHEKLFAYSFHATCDSKIFVVSTLGTRANVSHAKYFYWAYQNGWSIPLLSWEHINLLGGYRFDLQRHLTQMN